MHAWPVWLGRVVGIYCAVSALLALVSFGGLVIVGVMLTGAPGASEANFYLFMAIPTCALASFALYWLKRRSLFLGLVLPTFLASPMLVGAALVYLASN